MNNENENSTQEPEEEDFLDSLGRDISEFFFGKPEKTETKGKTDDSGRVEGKPTENGKKKKRSGVSVNIGGIAKEIESIITGAYERGRRDAESSAKKGKAPRDEKPTEDDKSSE